MEREDVRLTSRAMSSLMVPFAVLAGLGALQLYLFPDDTDRFFAWTLLPQLSATFMGAGFAAGVVLTLLSFRRRPWVVTRTAALVVSVFVVMMTIATFLHLDRMHLTAGPAGARAAAWLWLVVYVVVPPALLALTVLEWRRAGNDAPRGHPLPTALRAVLAAEGGAMFVAGMALFIRPLAMDSLWPWEVTPLAGRALAAWLIAIGVAALWVNIENDLYRTRPAAITFTVAGALWLVAVVRGSADMRWERVSAWVYLAVVVVAFGAGAWGWSLSSLRPEAND